ncbi:FecR family protein [Sphingomonas colocasiae]|uniref:FecR domain-containing protein n=1 Tax=Sphingomonas colocasiae TaxID=1848973 RepID=A0ABS7PPH5_9SPHN|nr:FecR domain-containing protein [Sphingomonas colocasiae]MBY8823224.1 FecR domain-containing protein [Sphingomonas colocasiae]
MSQRPIQEIDDMAARWVARMDSDAWSDADDAELGAWLALDPRHGGALVQAQALWSTLGQEETVEADPDVVRVDDAPPPVWTRRWLLASGGGAIAASLVAGLVVLGGSERYDTGVGEIRRVPLADGSTAAINTDSRIAVAVAETRRDVRLEKGEAWFQVVKDPRRPFVVEAGNVRVQAVGTAFSVRRREGGADVIVTEGVVEAWANGAEGQKIRIVAGAMAFVADNAAVRRPEPGAPAVERALAWRSGKIDLVATRVDDAIAEFNRYNRRRIVLRDAAIADERVDGVFRTDDPVGFSRVIAGSFGGSVDLSGPEEIRIESEQVTEK